VIPFPPTGVVSGEQEKYILLPSGSDVVLLSKDLCFEIFRLERMKIMRREKLSQKSCHEEVVL
jgi:hypothetical protein